jgi:ABC-type glycerol-3-phosphate transport system permease component
MPLAWPTTVAVAILSFALLWSVISPLIYLKSEANYTLPVGMTILK